MNARDVKSIGAAVEAAQATFDVAITAAARQLREAMLPYFQRKRLTFTAGNGTWYVGREPRDGERADDCDVSDDQLPRRIRDALSIEISHGMCLGFWVEPIESSDWSAS